MLEQLILYFVCKTKGHITKTQLVKFLYLADLYSVKWTGQQLTDLDWLYYLHGPWNQEIDAALEQMDVLSVRQEQSTFLVGAKHESLYETTEFSFSEGLSLMLDNIRREWSGAGRENFNALLSFVYETAPMLEARTQHQREEKVHLDLQLERKKLLAELGS
ncbi:MAG: type II toxin-antitoxin system antitoxin SocA domain-containing protein [Prochlorothrix sp.]|nr:type II toxin-antitoxin system antitoxin SocA domain-containing protein [Prochlorothrix sp.]